jgi:hypothetical protein
MWVKKQTAEVIQMRDILTDFSSRILTQEVNGNIIINGDEAV